MIELEEVPGGVILLVRAHAGARKNAVLGARDGALRVAVSAAPEKGKANRAIVEVLSRALGVSKTSIELVSGETSRLKRFYIEASDVPRLRAAVEQLARAS